MFKFFKKIFPKKQSSNDTKSDNNVIAINIDLSDENLKKLQQREQKEYENRWKFKEHKSEHSSDWVNSSEREEIDFFGHKKYSKNKKFCIVGVGANDYDYNIALIDVESQKVIFRFKYEKPSQFAVSNTGICAFVERYPKSDKLVILDIMGALIYEKRHNYPISYSPFDFSEDEKQFVYELHTTHKIFKVNL